MSEKRFKLIKPFGAKLGLKDIFIKDIQEDYYYYSTEQVVNLLNKFSEENNLLRKNNLYYNNQIMKRNTLINLLLRESYLLQSEAYNSYEDYLEKHFKPMLNSVEIDEI